MCKFAELITIQLQLPDFLFRPVSKFQFLLDYQIYPSFGILQKCSCSESDSGIRSRVRPPRAGVFQPHLQKSHLLQNHPGWLCVL